MANIEMVEYLGRLVAKEAFRVFVYRHDEGLKQIVSKLVNSYDEFQEHMASGVWFDSGISAQNAAPKKEDEKPLKK